MKNPTPKTGERRKGEDKKGERGPSCQRGKKEGCHVRIVVKRRPSKPIKLFPILREKRKKGGGRTGKGETHFLKSKKKGPGGATSGSAKEGGPHRGRKTFKLGEPLLQQKKYSSREGEILFEKGFLEKIFLPPGTGGEGERKKCTKDRRPGS